MADNYRTPQELLSFFKELEWLKTVKRQNKTFDNGRHENSAEHSWQLAIMSQFLMAYFPEPVNMERVMTMLLLHDVGEIHAGDTSAFDEEGKATSYEREWLSVQRTFGKLPNDLRQFASEHWQEFELGNSAEARYARVIDALAPLMNHFFIAEENENPSGLTKTQVLARKAFIAEESQPLWELTQYLIDASVKKGLYLDV
ncbi:HD domain-containing protein [Streptococcus merionis]|uniref:HD domain-containing protein n=1 Tax=Streptococcus merionis TaxID=400065 RepID=UPI003514B453